MHSNDLWDRFRAWLLDLPELQFRIDVSRMGLPSDYLKTMERPMAAAFDAMEALERGAIANPDEDRRVGHYWLRSPGLAPEPSLRDAIVGEIARVREFARAVHDGAVAPPGGGRFRYVLIAGIGGSALGPQFVADALGSTEDRLRPRFLDNTDPDGFDRVLGVPASELAATLTVVISKSGSTPETRNAMIEARAAYERAGLEFPRHAVAITQPGSALDLAAERDGFVARFPMWDWVGGRTSVTSVVGLVPAALQGIDIERLLDGAAAMDAATRVRRLQRNPAALLALSWYHAGEGRGARDMVVLPYKDRLALLSRYLQQLVMESLGKERDLEGRIVHQGIAVYGNKGSTDQHAYVQQLREGIPNFFVTFVQVLRDRPGPEIEVEPGVTSGDYLHGLMLGTRAALHDAGRPSVSLTVEEVSPEAIGRLIALFERAVGLYASLIRVNAYHQPGVEAGKRAAASILTVQTEALAALRARGDRGATCAELADDIGRPEVIEEVFQVLEHLAANPVRGVRRASRTGPFDATYRWVGVPPGR